MITIKLSGYQFIILTLLIYLVSLLVIPTLYKIIIREMKKQKEKDRKINLMNISKINKANLKTKNHLGYAFLILGCPFIFIIYYLLYKIVIYIL